MLRKTPLHEAASNGDAEKVRQLIANKADVNARDYEDWTPLHHAAFHGYAEVVKLLLEVEGIDLEAKDIHGLTPLHEVARCEKRNGSSDGDGHYEIVQLLLASGADPSAKENNLETPLHYVARGSKEVDFVEIGKLLIEKTHNIDTKNDCSETALHRAAKYGCLPMIELLLNHGANYKALTDQKKTPYMLAQDYSQPEATNLIIKLREPQIILGLENTIEKQRKEIKELKEQLSEILEIMKRNVNQNTSSVTLFKRNK